jgi:hypothetical protein
MDSRGQSASRSFSTVTSRTRQPSRFASRMNSCPFSKLAMHMTVSGRFSDKGFLSPRFSVKKARPGSRAAS